MVMFENKWNESLRGMAVKMNLGSGMITGFAMAWKSGIPVAISGPDLNPVVFLGIFISTISQDIGKQLRLDYPEVQIDHRRRLGDEDTSAFCSWPDMSQDVRATCDEYYAQVLATTVFTVTVTTLLFACIFCTLGAKKLSSYVSFVPTSVMEAFLSCVGYKVFSYALKFCEYEIRQFLPAAVIGVFMYFVKVARVGNPAVVLPLLLLVPLGAFHIYIATQGGDLEAARADGLMFPRIANAPWYVFVTDGFLSYEKINIQAWLLTLPDLLVMVIVVVLDCLLKVSATENKLPIRVDANKELWTVGVANLLTSMFSTCVGYMQLKFNVINYGIVHNISDRRAGFLYALLCAVCYFGTIELINFLPRFFLSALLFFAGSGFVAENLWGSRHFLSYSEWLHIFLILSVFILSGQLLWAVVVGCIITGLDFLYQYSKVSTVRGGGFAWGGELASRERRDPLAQFFLEHLKDNWLLVVRLKGFLFFATAARLKELVHGQLVAQLKMPKFKRAKFLLLDCASLDGLDASAAKALRKLAMEASAVDVTLLWGDVSPKVLRMLQARHVVTRDSFWFSDIHEAALYVEQKGLEYLVRLQEQWSSFHPAFETYRELRRRQSNFEPFESLYDKGVTSAAARQDPWAYCYRKKVPQGALLWEKSSQERHLLLVHSGAIGVFKAKPMQDMVRAVDDNDDSCLERDAVRASIEVAPQPLQVYRHGWFLNANIMVGGRTSSYAMAMEDSEIMCFDESNTSQMTTAGLITRSYLMRSLLRQKQAEEHLYAQLYRTGLLTAGVQLEMGDETTQFELETKLSGQTPFPFVLTEQLRSLQLADALDRLGLYNDRSPGTSTDEGSIEQPPLPTPVEALLLKNFAMYADVSDECLSVVDVPEVFKSAGLFDICDLKDCQEKLDRQTFLSKSREAFMVQISKDQKESISSLFHRWSDEDVLSKHQFKTLLKNELDLQSGTDELESYWNTYAQDDDGMRCENFRAFICRLLKSHEVDLALFKAFRWVLRASRDTSSPASGERSVAKLAVRAEQSVNGGRLSQAEAKEILWVAGLLAGTTEGELSGLEVAELRRELRARDERHHVLQALLEFSPSTWTHPMDVAPAGFATGCHLSL
eukprot:TRINITY_DN9547_c0_g1_i1.p1 TRINITY_DN9547_c0_g1~~TRINITY_DN9547_c0_g1_i1.p1  ORF type:complete len:1303 (-),score=213.68 TRINITY_DN9547_c0_g1_i1:1048-4380(-)